MHWIALVDSKNHVCCRYRLAAFQPFFEQAGHSLEFLPLSRHWWNRLRVFRQLQGASVILQRRLLPGWELALLRRSVQRLIFDFDDAVFHRDSYSPRGLHHTGRMNRFAATIRAADAVVAGNHFLAAQASRWTLQRLIRVIPTCINLDRYPASLQESKPGLTMVWIGSSSTLKGLEAIRPILELIGREVEGSRLKLIADRFLQLNDLPVETCSWQEASETREIATGDVGISWIPDDDWSRGKCGLKVLQYMASRLPVIGNPVGVQLEMIKAGKTGYLAHSSQDWVDALKRLAIDLPLRRSMGQSGRELVEREYSVAQGAQTWIDLLNQMQKQAA